MSKAAKSLSDELREVLGEEGFVQLCQAFGGTRLYVPCSVRDGHEIIQAIGVEAARKLVRRFSPTSIRVPLAKRERVLFYRQQGLSHAKIARLMGMCETGVEKITRQARTEEAMTPTSPPEAPPKV
ncbi:MAG: hypothetical protein V2I27_03680 [Erythrobacter sp.]|jgi:hypothetical protein|nr:hypothetical protein [Erythrobacter sp.]